MFNWILDLIFPVRSDEAILRDLSQDEFLSLLEPQIEERTEPAAVALLPIADRRVRAVIHEAKYHGSAKAFSYLAAALAEYLKNDDRFDGLRHAVLVPIPLGPKRRLERGFNQVEEVARLVWKETGVTLTPDLLVRTRETVSQVSLKREARKQNMKGAFAAPRGLDPALLYIVLDDVTTTGATLSAAIKALKEGGAHDFLPIALAH